MGGIEVLYVDLALKVLRVAELHEFVRVACVAILAAEFAASIGVDGPVKRHAPAVASGHITARGQIEVFDAPLGFELRTLGGKSGDANELGHTPIFALYSPKVKGLFPYPG